MRKLFTSIILFTLFAVFANAQETVIVKLNTGGSGGTKEIIVNGATNTSGKIEVAKGTLVQLKGTVLNESKKFAFFTLNNRWTEGGIIVSNKNPYSFIADEDEIYYVNYVDTAEDLTANVNITSTEGGRIAGLVYGHIYELGEDISATAVANDGYKFVNWTDAEGNESGTFATFEGVVTTKEMTIRANFVSESETSVESIGTTPQDTVIYDLCGRRVNGITKAGVYIVDGRKVIIK